MNQSDAKTAERLEAIRLELELDGWEIVDTTGGARWVGLVESGMETLRVGKRVTEIPTLVLSPGFEAYPRAAQVQIVPGPPDPRALAVLGKNAPPSLAVQAFDVQPWEVHTLYHMNGGLSVPPVRIPAAAVAARMRLSECLEEDRKKWLQLLRAECARVRAAAKGTSGFDFSSKRASGAD